MLKDLKFDFDDVTIVPAVLSSIRSRSECNPFYKTGELPIIVSPMDTVININNYQLFNKVGMLTCIPRNVNITKHKDLLKSDINFISISLDEAETILNKLKGKKIESLHISDLNLYNEIEKYTANNILIDIANGHMKDLINVIKEYKKVFKTKNLMVGNIANPLTFIELAKAGANYIRCSIGSGSACLTASNTAVHYPLASLIADCYKIKQETDNELVRNCNIIADGGIRSYKDIITALALGADYVMLGSMLNKCIESAGDNYWKGFKLSDKFAYNLWKRGYKIEKKYRGMSTKEVQKSWGHKKLKTSEGIVKRQNVEYTIDSWTENLRDYIKSAMSYTNKTTIEDFIGKVEMVQITPAAFKRFNK